MKSPLLLLISAASVFAQTPERTQINAEKQRQSVRLHLGAGVPPEHREAAVKLARNILRTDDTHEITRVRAAETLVSAGVLDAEVKALEEEMRGDAANLTIPSNLYYVLRHLADHAVPPLKNNERWVPAAEAVVARKAPRFAAAAVDLAGWHFKYKRTARTGQYCLAAVEAEPALSFSRTGVKDWVSALREAGVLEQVISAKQQWLTRLALNPSARMVPPHPLGDLQGVISILADTEITRPLARRLLKAALAAPGSSTGENWLALAVQSLPAARACGALEEVSHAVSVTLSPAPGQTLTTHLDFWGHPGDVLWSKHEPPGLVLLEVVKETGHLPELIAKLRELTKPRAEGPPHGLLLEALLAAECLQNRAEARSFAAGFIRSGYYIEPVLFAALPGLTVLDYYRPAIQLQQEQPPDLSGKVKLFDDALPQIVAANDMELLRALLKLQYGEELAHLASNPQQLRIHAQFSRAAECVRFMLYAGMNAEAEALAYAAVQAQHTAVDKDPQKSLRLAHSLWRALQHAGRTDAADRLYREGRVLLAGLAPAGNSEGRFTEERAAWMLAALRRGAAASVAADLSGLMAQDSRLQLIAARAEAWLAAQASGGAPLAWLATDATGKPLLRWLTGTVPFPTEQGLLDAKAGTSRPSGQFFTLWPGFTAPAPPLLAVQSSGDGMTWQDVPPLAASSAAGSAPLSAEPWLRVECRREGNVLSSPAVPYVRPLSWNGMPDSRLPVKYLSQISPRFSAAETVEWKTLAGGPHPESTAWTARVVLPGRTPVSVVTPAFPLPWKEAAFSGWVRIESSAAVSASLYVEDPSINDHTGSLLLTELDVMDGAWQFLGPNPKRKASPPTAAAATGTVRFRLEIKTHAGELPLPDVRVSCADWQVQAAVPRVEARK
jgi:hypothetical protein